MQSRHNPSMLRNGRLIMTTLFRCMPFLLIDLTVESRT